jgi:hypothetical protein
LGNHRGRRPTPFLPAEERQRPPLPSLAVYNIGSFAAGRAEDGVMAEMPLTEEQRQEAFKILIVGQDYGMSVGASRKMVAEMFGLDVSQVLQIELEGKAAGWPPL